MVYSLGVPGERFPDPDQQVPVVDRQPSRGQGRQRRAQRATVLEVDQQKRRGRGGRHQDERHALLTGFLVHDRGNVWNHTGTYIPPS